MQLPWLTPVIAVVAPWLYPAVLQEYVTELRSKGPFVLEPRVWDYSGVNAPPVDDRVFLSDTAAGPRIMSMRGATYFAGPPITMAPAVAGEPGGVYGYFQFAPQTLHNETVLVGFNGTFVNGYGKGTYGIFNQHYELVREIRHPRADTDPDAALDFHEFHITPANTVLVTSYYTTQSTRFAGGRKWVLDGEFFEIDIDSGRVLFSWRAMDHVRLHDSYRLAWFRGLSRAHAYDYFHINSIDKYPNGDFLVSSRHMGALYRIDGATGNVKWKLGGRHSSFRIGPHVQFSWAHHARLHAVDASDPLSNGAITLFDNSASGLFGATAPLSRAIVLTVDPSPHDGVLPPAAAAAPAVSLAHSYPMPNGISSTSQGSVQLLESNGNVFVGWGAKPYVTEFDGQSGKVLYHAHLGDGRSSYRAKRGQWTGMPRWPFDIVVQEQPDDELEEELTRDNNVESASYNGQHRWMTGGDGKAGVPAASGHESPRDSLFLRFSVRWNGATEIASWVLLGAARAEGQESERLVILDMKPWDDLWTHLYAPSAFEEYVVRARFANGTMMREQRLRR